MRKLTKLDKKLITELKADGRCSATSLGNKLGVDPRTIRTRIESLRNDGILRIAAIIEHKSIGYPIIADAFIDIEIGSVENVAKKLAAHPSVSYVAVPIGNAKGINIQLRCQSNEQLGHILNETFPKIPGIQNIDFYIIHRIIKDIHEWDLPEGS